MTAFRNAMEAIRTRDLVTAERWLREAYKAEPENAEVLAWLGQTASANGARIEGLRFLADAGRVLLRAPVLAPRLYEIVTQLQQWRAFPEALELLDAMVARMPRDGRARQLRAAALAMLNRPAEALAEGEALAQLAPGNLAVEVFLGSLEADAGQHARAEQRLARLLRGSPPPREAFRALKEVAKLLDRRGGYKEAFDCMESAGQFARQVPEYAQVSRDVLPRQIAENRAHFSAEGMRRWQDVDFGDRPAPLFVIGFFRSGTTLTQEVLAAHPNVFVADEAPLIHALAKRIDQIVPGAMPQAKKLAKLTEADVRDLRALYWKQVEGMFGPIPPDTVFVDKFTMSAVDVGLINTLFPDGKLAFLIRDPRDVCISCLQQLMPPTPATVQLLTWADTVNFYTAVTEWWLHIRGQLSMDWIELRYEDAVTDFTGTYQRLFAHVGVAWDESVAEFHRHAAGKHISTPSRSQVAQPIYDSSLARWRRYEAQIAPRGAPLAPLIEALGYPAA